MNNQLILDHIKKLYHKLPTIIIAVMIGIVIGFWSGQYFISHKIDEAIKLERGLYNKKIYNITLNAELNKN